MNFRTFSFITLLLLAWLPRVSAQVNASATFTVTGDWGAGANVTMRLYNHGTTAIPAWPLEFDFGRTIGPYNNAVVSSHVGAHYVMNKESYYPANIPPGGSLYFDMLVTPGAVGADAPINVKLAGVAIGASTLSISDASIAEGAAGTTALNFTVTLSAAPAAGQTVTVNYATTSGTAVSGADFVAGSGTVTFAAGETVKGIAVLVNGDAVEESDETLVVTLSGATGAAISDASGTGTIVNDDFIFHVSIADAGVFEGDSGTTILGVTVSISPAATGAVSVDVQSQAGTAAAGQDFTAVSQTITFAVGETTKTVSVPIVGDAVAEAAEAFTLNLSNPSAANVIIADALANVIIYDNDGGGSSVLIGELCSAPSSRKLRWLADGTPRLGMGVPWMNAGYADAWWQTGALPAGFGYAGLGTDVAAQMSGRTPSLYLRREFTVSAADAASGAALKLQLEFDDGFIAYVNGVEVTRANMGPAKQFIFASQEAFNARPSASVQEFDLGAASARLVAGTNVIAIHAANAVTDPAANNFAATPTFRINAGLLVTGGSTLVGYGAAGGAWRMFVGLAEPSGGVFDPVLLTGSFTPPAGQEEDFEDTEEFSDWIELNNYGTAPVDLGGWGLSDNASAPMKWRIPAGTMVPAGGHLLVLCDGREESNGFSALTPRTLIAPGASWKYFDQVSAPLPDWNALAFDDAAWSAGPAPLGYSPTNQDGAATVIAGGTNTHLTNYFRRHFTVANPAAFSGVMTLRFQRDDGIVIWLNGAFLASDNITTPTTHTTPADSNVADEAAWITRTVALTGLVAGDNVIAVEVHQNSGASTDTRFDLDLSAYEQVPGSATTMLHANFKLDDEALTLSSPSGALMDTIAAPPRQSSFYSWGRSGANPTTFGFLDATPGGPNAATAIASRAESPEFLKPDLTPLPSGFYMGAQSLVLRSATPSSTIRYTTDGSDPTDTTGTAYSGPIALTAPNDKTAVIIRARTFAAGMLPSKDIAGTYLMNQHTGLRAMPVLSLVQDAGRAFFLPGGVMAISGGSYDGDTLWQPGTIASYNVPQHHGPTTEREISAELIHPDGTPGFRDDVGLRMSGSAYGRPRYKFQQTANSPWTIYEPKEKGSFNLVWRDDFGAKDLDHEIFPGWDTRTFRQLRLRAGSNDNFNPFISDEYMRRLLGEMGHDHIRGMFAMLYVNGSFKGMYNVCERLRNETFKSHFRTENDFDVKYVNEYPAGDNVANTTFRATYDKDLSVAANFDAVRAAADLENVADYYALNIYANTWDWATWQAGANNYVLYRERVAAAKWRFTVWDGEGTFNNQSYFSQPPSFNVITNHLTGADDTNELATIWKRLVGVAPFTGTNTKGNVEFRLLVADRINKHLWNGGVLDDRAAAGRFVGLKNELKAMVKTGVDYLDNAWREDWFTTWTNTSTGRRAYLFGGQATQLRDAGVWPLTEPVVFSQHGGVVASNYALAMTSNVATAGQTAQILYTLDGGDPRVEGGGIAAGAQTYAGAVTISGVTTVKARARNNTTGEWSALTATQFLTDAVAASAANLVVGEIMYHPPDATAAEQAAGFSDTDEFEYIRLQAIGAATVDLRGLDFTTGVTFDFATGSVAALAPGESVYLVRNLAAFQVRYGAAFNAFIAGQYAGNLRNSGEQIILTGADGADVDTLPDVVRDFTYLTAAPWPLGADGLGGSLLLVNPANNPDHTLAASWTTTALPAGELAFVLADSSVGEGAGPHTATVTRTNGSAGSVSISYTFTPGSAGAGDFGGVAGTLIFGDGVLSQDITIPITNDAEVESAETFTLALSNATGGAALGVQTTHTVTILDNEITGTLAFSGTTANVLETAGSVVLTVVRSGGSDGTVTVDFQTTEGSAGAADFTATNGTLTFTAGQMSKNISIPITNDPFVEADEAFTITLSGVSLGANVLATVTIQSEDMPPPAGALAFALAASATGEGAGLHNVTVARIGGSAGSVSVGYTFTPGTAGVGDFTGVAGTLTFGDGELSQAIAVPISDDADLETSETFTLTLGTPSGGAALGAQTLHTVTITDNEVPLPVIALGVGSASEPGTGKITVTRTGDLTRTSSVHFTLTSGTATAGTDFTGTSGDVTFAIGETTRDITFTVADDEDVEGDHDLTCTLSAPSDATLGLAVKLYTITDDDAAFTLRKTNWTGVVNFTDTQNGYGMVSVSESAKGIVTGSAVVNGRKYRFKGTPSTTGRLVSQHAVKLSRTASETHTLALRMRPGVLDGTFSSPAATFGIIGGEPITGTKKAPVPNAGTYTILLPADAASPVGETTGWLLLKVAATGKVVAKGALPDGTKFSASTGWLGDSAYLAAGLYAKKSGYLLGHPTRQLDASVNGEFFWRKPANPKAPLHPAGFDVFGISATGHRYIPPARGAAILPGLIASNRIASLTFTGGGLAAPLGKVFTINTRNAVSGITGDAHKLRVSLDAGSGTFSGKFTHPGDGKSRAFNGVIIQSLGGYFGEGFFPGVGASGKAQLSTP